MVNEAKEKFLEYRQVVSIEFFVFILNETVSALGFFVMGNFARQGYNKSSYILRDVTEDHWNRALELTGIFSCKFDY